MSAPVFLFNNVLNNFNVVADSEYQNHGIRGAINTLTYEYWAFDADTATVTITHTGTVNGLGMVLDNATFALVQVYYSTNGVDYTLAASRSFINNGTNFIPFANTYGTHFRVVFTKAVPSVALVRNLMLGDCLEFERCIMQTHNPAPYNRSTEFTSNQSGTGEFLGRSAKPTGFETGYSFGLITATWGRNQFQELVETAQKAAYYVLWNPELYPNEAFFGWTDEDIGISYTGDASLMAASWNARGIATVAVNALLNNLLLLEDGGMFLTENDKFITLES